MQPGHYSMLLQTRNDQLNGPAQAPSTPIFHEDI